ncbi:MAG: NAD(P)/FAD-dependent oxidoreductase, partial [bacterium]|nr:NAD(P)/FAD-dependent oxidoreductase [bacterium]
MSGQSSFDVAILGAGLSGLTAGLHLQAAGMRVVILERRGVAGGLCGTHVLDGYEFVIACNDFGQGLEREMQALGVSVAFESKRTRFHFETGVIELPPTARSLLRLARDLPDYVRLALAVVRDEPLTLSSFARQRVRSETARDLLTSLAYPIGRSPCDAPLALFKDEFSSEYRYDYNHPRTPIGGPRALVDAMVARFEELGGTLVLDTACREPRADAHAHVVETERGSFSATHWISSLGRWDEYPASAKAGLSISTLHVAVRKELVFPQGIHTLLHVPPQVDDWLDRIDRGEAPDAFGFHFFRSDLPARPDHYTMNAYVYLPRGVDRPDDLQVAQ